MDEERKIIARACEARVLGVWALHTYDEYDRYAVTHIPTGRKLPQVLSHAGAELAWRALGEKLPRFAEDAAFGADLEGDVNLETVRKIVEAAVRGLGPKP